jgi:preprotein translocase subunit SecY
MARVGGMKDSSFLPLKINIAGVIPPIFASSILMFPSAIAQFLGDNSELFLSFFRRGGLVYLISFSALILFFSYFYSSIIFNTKEVSDNLKKSNCFILGIRPGNETALYLDSLVLKLTTLGGIYLVAVCIIPEILITNYSLPLYIGGTGVLIMVNVILDLINQVQSHLFSSKYSNSGNRKRKVRVRSR